MIYGRIPFVVLTAAIIHEVFGFEFVPADTVVSCYRASVLGNEGCVFSSSFIGRMIARDCCNGNGNTLMFNSKCLGCFFAGFNVTSLNFTAADAGRAFQVPFVVHKKVPSSAVVRLETDSNRFSEISLLKRNEYVSNYPTNVRSNIEGSAPIELSFDLTISGAGNSKALEPALQFSLQTSFVSASGDIAIVLFADVVHVTIEDLDVLVFKFDKIDGTVFTEGDEGGVIVERNQSVRPSRPVFVFVTALKFSGFNDLGMNEYAADSSDFFLNETETYVFEENGDSRIQKLFSAKEDNVVELGMEVFEVVLTTNETKVVLAAPNVSKLFIRDDDDFHIGFENNQIEKVEGESIRLTIVQTNDVVGQIRTNDAFNPPKLNNIPSSAKVDKDYNFTDAMVSAMRINETSGKLLPVSFYVGSTFMDDILEGAEMFFISLSPTDILQIGDNPYAFVTIRDATPGIVKIKAKEYNVSEGDGQLKVCAGVIGASLDLLEPLIIDFELTPGTAKFEEDYINITSVFSFDGRSQESCNTFIIRDNQVKEELYESFFVNLLNYTGNTFTSLQVDTSLSTIYILDDDRAEIFFSNESVQFFENAGNQLIFLSLQGGALASPVVAIIKDTNTDADVGRVQFVSTSSTSQTASFTFDNPDNQIALEGSKTIRLGISHLEGIEIGSPSEMTLLIHDDDVVSVMFTSSSFNYSENHGVVSNIELQISNQIAQELKVLYSGDTSLQTGVVVSGASVVSSVIFPINSTAYSVQVIDPFTLFDDETALELDEHYQIRLINSSVVKNVVLGSPTTITIFDDDLLMVMFSKTIYRFFEGETHFIGVVLSNQIAKNLTVSILGVPGIQNYVVNSGPIISEMLTFHPSSSLDKNFSVTAEKDFFALEHVESYHIHINNIHSVPNVNIGKDSIVEIVDIDVVLVDFMYPMVEFNEGDGIQYIEVTINQSVATPLSIIVFGESTTADNIDVSIEMVNATVMFEGLGGNRSEVFMFYIRNDETGLEKNEVFEIQFIESFPSRGVILGENLKVSVMDDDDVTISFEKKHYSVYESDMTFFVNVVLNRMIAQNAFVQVIGDSEDIQTISKSGVYVNRTVSFSANDANLIVPFPLDLIDDQNALEDVEIYALKFVNHYPSTIQTKLSSFVTILDDDVVTINFSSVNYTFYENEVGASVGISIDKTILKLLSVVVFGISEPRSGVVASGKVLNDTVLFQPQTILLEILSIAIQDDSVALEYPEMYSLKFLSSTPSKNIHLGMEAMVTIQDDDDVGVYFENAEHTFNESDGLVMVRLLLNANISRPVSVFVFGAILDDRLVSPSLPDINSTIIFVPNGPVFHDITFMLIDDEYGLEDPELVTLFISNPNVQDINIATTTIIKILDDDVAEVITDIPQMNVTEGEDASVCVRVTGMMLKGIVVTLGSKAKSAEDGTDFIGGMKNVTIPAGSNMKYCANYSTLQDTEFEGTEEFDIEIKHVSLINFTFQANSQLLRIGSQNSTTIQIFDIHVHHSRSCIINSVTQIITTFGESNEYSYNQTCEHSLLLEMTPFGEFGVFFESFDRTLKTSRVGLRLGLDEFIVISVYNMTIIKHQGLKLINVSSSSTMLFVHISSLDFQLEISNGVIVVQVGVNSLLEDYNGLCGDVNGNLLLKNESIVDINNTASVKSFLTQNLVPPSETFIRTVTRQECGLTAEDLETGDPMFIVPLYTPSTSNSHSYSLCYEIHGEKDETYNFISDECTQVYAHIYETNNMEPHGLRAFHAVDRITVYAVNDIQQCVNVTVSLESNLCSTSLQGSELTGESLLHGISVRQSANRTRISVPNCADNRLIMNILCRNVGTSAPYLEFRVVRGLNLKESSHGIIGQFWNIESKVSKYNHPLKDGMVMENAYLVELKPKSKSMRSFIGFLHSRTWNFNNSPCIYAGNAQGGPIYEAADGEPNDSLIEGNIGDYSMSDFKYNKFNEC